MDLDSIIDSISAFKDRQNGFYHNALGITDERAGFLMLKAEDVVYDFLGADEDTWEVEDVSQTLLQTCKDLSFNSVEIFYFLCYGLNFLLAHIEPTVFFLGDGFITNWEIDINNN